MFKELWLVKLVNLEWVVLTSGEVPSGRVLLPTVLPVEFHYCFVLACNIADNKFFSLKTLILCCLCLKLGGVK